MKLNRPDIKLDIVLDSRSKYKNEIQAIINQHSNIAMYNNLPSIAYLMHKADLSIGAGGSTTWERCCLGLHNINCNWIKSREDSCFYEIQWSSINFETKY